jgi:hypothetical protein
VGEADDDFMPLLAEGICILSAVHPLAESSRPSFGSVDQVSSGVVGTNGRTNCRR